MQITKRYSKVQKIFGTVSAMSLIIGALGLAGLMISGVGTTQLYWNALWVFMALTATGVLMIRIYGMVWSK